MSQSAISRRVNGDLPFDVDELGRLADALGIDVVDFFGSAPVGPFSGGGQQKAPGRVGPGASLPDLDSNQEPPRSWFAPVSQLEAHRASKAAAHSSVRSDHDGTASDGVA